MRKLRLGRWRTSPPASPPWPPSQDWHEVRGPCQDSPSLEKQGPVLAPASCLSLAPVCPLQPAAGFGRTAAAPWDVVGREPLWNRTQAKMQMSPPIIIESGGGTLGNRTWGVGYPHPPAHQLARGPRCEAGDAVTLGGAGLGGLGGDEVGRGKGATKDAVG